MAEFPFLVTVKPTSSSGQAQTISCVSLLRDLGEKRKVLDAIWGQRPVVMKVFAGPIKAKYHMKREWRGLSLLRELGLSSPEPLFFGQTEDGRWAVVAEKIADASTVLDALHKMTNAGRKLDLLVLTCKEIAKQHGKGVLQKDLHLGNFLLNGDKVFALDPGQMRFFSRPVIRSRSISKLASLACHLAASDTESIARLCEEYFKARGWRFEKPDGVLFQKQLTVHRKRGIEKGLKKRLRTSKRYLRIKAGRYLAVFNRGFCQGTEALNFIEQIDAMMDNGEILKNGNTSYVSRVAWNGKNVVVKRYNHKGFIHSLRHTIKRSRAHHGWLHANRLGMLRIATPRPLAYIEQRRGLLVWKSYLVTEYVEGRKLYDFLRDSNVTEEERSKVTQQTMELLDKLGKCRISHGDLKHSNILIGENSCVLTDLDGMKVHKCGWLFKIRRSKDLARLDKNVQCYR